MNIPLTLGTWIAAALPIATLLILLVRYNWSVVRASAVSAGLSIAAAAFVFQAPWNLVADQSLKGAWNSLSIIAVIFPAILIYEIGAKSDAFHAIQNSITALIPDKLLQVLALGWCFSSFLQGPSGFGVPVAVTAPLLVGIGVKPLWAVFIPVLAHAWGTTFGTLAMAWEALPQQVALDAVSISRMALWSAVFTGILNVLSGVLICWFYAGKRGMRHGANAVFVLGLTMAGGQVVVAQFTPALAAVIPSTIALGVVFWLARQAPYRDGNAPESGITVAATAGNASAKIGFHQALLPYYLLVGISLFVLLSPPVRDYLGQWKMGFAFAQARTGYGFTTQASDMYGPTAWLTHSGFFLLVSAMISMVYYLKIRVLLLSDASHILRRSAHKFVPAAVSVVLLLVTSKVMSGSGQISVLAGATASVTGSLYGFISPAVGALGAFMSSSNVSSNILFAKFQSTMAALTGYDQVMLLAAQTSGGAIGTILAPSKILLGTTTVGITGTEGQIINKLLPPTIAVGLIIGLIVLVMGRV